MQNNPGDFPFMENPTYPVFSKQQFQWLWRRVQHHSLPAVQEKMIKHVNWRMTLHLPIRNITTQFPCMHTHTLWLHRYDIITDHPLFERRIRREDEKSMNQRQRCFLANHKSTKNILAIGISTLFVGTDVPWTSNHVCSYNSIFLSLQ